MPTRKHAVVLPTLIILAIAIFAITVSLRLFYQSAYDRQLQNLENRATTFASILEAVAQHEKIDNVHPTQTLAQQVTQETLQQGLDNINFRQGDIELLIGYRDGDTIRFLHNSKNGHTVPNVAFDGKLAQPMYEALHGKSGKSDELLDYSGVPVLAGYAPIPSLNMGVVFKIHRDAFIAPYLKTAYWALGIMLIMAGLYIAGFIWYNRQTNKHLAKVEAHSKKEILRAEELSNGVINNAGALILVLDQSGRIQRFNQVCEKTSGYTESEIKGKYPWDTFLPPEDAERVRTHAFDALARNPEKLTGTFTNYWQHKDGTKTLLSWTNSLILDNHGKMEYMIAVGTDITEKHKSEEKLKQNEARLNTLISTSPTIIYSCKTKDDYGATFISQNVHEIMGYKSEEFINDPKFWASHIHPEDAKYVFENLPSVFNNDVHTHEYRFLKSNGNYAWMQDQLRLIRDSHGNPVEIIGSWTDITSRKNIEDNIRANTQIIEAVLNSTPVMIAYLDTNMNFIRVNNAYAAADRKTPDFYIGKNHFELFPNTENEALFYHVIKTGEPYTANARPFEYEHSPERGITHWDWTLNPIKDTNNNVTGLVLSLTNVTERIKAIESTQRSETFLRNLNETLESRVQLRTRELQNAIQRNEIILETTHDAFCVADMQGHIRSANKAMCNLLGYPLQELIQLGIPDIEANENPEEVARHMAIIDATGHDRFDTKQRRKDGTIIDVEVSVSCIEIGGEKMHYAFLRDISQRKKHERELRKARDAAEHANRAKSEFLSRMSHELRTPLNAIIGFSQVLSIENINDLQKTYVTEIHQAGEHLLALINELLDMSRIETGNLATTIQSVDVTNTVTQAIHFIGNIAKSKNITIRNNCTPNIKMLADPIRLRQILINLLSNATKYNSNNGFIYIGCQLQNKNMLRITVTDTGIGIRPENINKLFHPFERLDAEQQGIDGAGIGLALSQQLAVLMGGTLGVESAPGKGSTFWIDLPVSPVTGTDQLPETHQENTFIDMNKHLVLYIEDNLSNLKVVEAIFQRHPELHLISATNGYTGIELAQRYRPEAILLDIHLPDLDGFKVLDKLKSFPETQNIPVIAVSADAMPLDIKRGLDAGFIDYLTKPIKVNHLIETLGKTLAA